MQSFFIMLIAAIFVLISVIIMIWLTSEYGVPRGQIQKSVSRKRARRKFVDHLVKDYLDGLNLNQKETHTLLQKIGLWNVPSLFPFPMLEIIEQLNEDKIMNAITTLLEYCNYRYLYTLSRKWWYIDYFRVRKKDISIAFRFHKNFQYQSCISILIPLIESIIRNWIDGEITGDDYGKSEMKIIDLSLKEPPSILLYQLILEPINNSPVNNLIKNLEIFRDWLNQIDQAFPKREVGDYGEYDGSLFTNENCTKLFLYLDTISFIIIGQREEKYPDFQEPSKMEILDSEKTLEEKILETKCKEFVEIKKCIKCLKQIPIWMDICESCESVNPIPPGKFYTIYSILQKDKRDNKVIVNYAGTGYITSEGRNSELNIIYKNVYENIVFLFDSESLLWKKNFYAPIKFLNFIPKLEKIVVITLFNKEESLLNPLDQPIEKSRRAFQCELCGKTISKGNSFWKGYINHLNDINSPEMFESVLVICENCRPLKFKPDFPIAHVILVNFNGVVLMDYEIVLDNFVNPLKEEIKIEFLLNFRFSVKIFDKIYIFDSEKNQLIKMERSAFGKITARPTF